MYGEDAVADQMCQEWLAKFCAGDFSLDDAPRSSRPVEVDSDQIESLIENNQLYHSGDSRHTQNIQINKFIGENEKCVFLFDGKKLNGLFGQSNIIYEVIPLTSFAPTRHHI